MAVPQTPQKKVGAGGCIVGLVLAFLAIVAFVGGIAWGIGGFVGILTDLGSSPSVTIGETGSVNVSSPGEQWLVLGNTNGSTLPILDPTVSVKDSSGSTVTVTRSTTANSSSSTSAFRSIGFFEAKSAGTYEIDVGNLSSASSSSKVYVIGLDLNSIGLRILVGIIAGVVLFIIAIIVGIIWLVRRSSAKKANRPVYTGPGGGYGPPPGPYGGAAPPPGPPPGGPPGGQWGAPPPGPPQPGPPPGPPPPGPPPAGPPPGPPPGPPHPGPPPAGPPPSAPQPGTPPPSSF